MNDRKMIVKFMGGLGNQMFQYAKAKSLQKEQDVFEGGHPIPLHLDLLYYSEQETNVVKGGITGRKFELDIFELAYAGISKSTIADRNAGRVVHGYFQHPDQFANVADEIVQTFSRLVVPYTPQFSEMKNEIECCNSVCIHVRRGDYVTNPNSKNWHGVLPLSYYIQAIQKIEDNAIQEDMGEPTFFVFSDDIEWCRENMPTDRKMIFVGDEYAGINAVEHLHLMALCGQHIIANSSFSWWAAFMAWHKERSRRVIGPKNWLANGTGNEILDIEGWIKL